MSIDSDEKQTLAIIKNLFETSKFSKDVGMNIEDMTEKTDIRELNMDSLDTMEYLFAIDEEFGVEIPDDVFQEKELAIIGNLIAYLKNKP